MANHSPIKWFHYKSHPPLPPPPSPPPYPPYPPFPSSSSSSSSSSPPCSVSYNTIPRMERKESDVRNSLIKMK